MLTSVFLKVWTCQRSLDIWGLWKPLLLRPRGASSCPLTAPPDLGRGVDLVVYSWSDQLLSHTQVIAGEHERDFMLPRYRVLTPILQKFLPSPGSWFSSLGDVPICKESNRTQSLDCLYLLVWLLKQRQVCPKLSLELAGSSSSCHRGLWRWVCAHLVLLASRDEWLTSQVCHRIRHSCFCLRWHLSGWGRPEMTEAQRMNVLCRLPQGKWTHRHVVSQQETEGLKWDSVAKYPQSNGELRPIWPALGLWGWFRREAEEAGMCQSPALRPVAYSWVAGAAPCPRLHHLDQLLG